jgi:tetraprenyl-beta-curcumene synthase
MCSVVFARTVAVYVLLILPAAARELAGWRRVIATMPDPGLRAAATASLRKRGNIEGAAMFAALAPRGHRRRAVRALVAFQTTYNYLDVLSELPSEDPAANARQLHAALRVALDPGAPHCDYYARNPAWEDGGYLRELVDACRGALGSLPSAATVAPALRRLVARIVEFQALNRREAEGGHASLARWATEITPAGSGLRWWETAASAGTSLGVHALIASAACELDVHDVHALERAYHPWLGALHTLLDSLVDLDEDHGKDLRSLLDYYSTPGRTSGGLERLAGHARAQARRLPNAAVHVTIATAMCSYYLSAPECRTPQARAVTRALKDTFGSTLGMALLLFRLRRRVRVATRRAYH